MNLKSKFFKYKSLISSVSIAKIVAVTLLLTVSGTALTYVSFSGSSKNCCDHHNSSFRKGYLNKILNLVLENNNFLFKLFLANFVFILAAGLVYSSISIQIEKDEGLLEEEFKEQISGLNNNKRSSFIDCAKSLASSIYRSIIVRLVKFIIDIGKGLGAWALYGCVGLCKFIYFSTVFGASTIFILCLISRLWKGYDFFDTVEMIKGKLSHFSSCLYEHFKTLFNLLYDEYKSESDEDESKGEDKKEDEKKGTPTVPTGKGKGKCNTGDEEEGTLITPDNSTSEDSTNVPPKSNNSRSLTSGSNSSGYNSACSFNSPASLPSFDIFGPASPIESDKKSRNSCCTCQ